MATTRPSTIAPQRFFCFFEDDVVQHEVSMSCAPICRVTDPCLYQQHPNKTPQPPLSYPLSPNSLPSPSLRHPHHQPSPAPARPPGPPTPYRTRPARRRARARPRLAARDVAHRRPRRPRSGGAAAAAAARGRKLEGFFSIGGVRIPRFQGCLPINLTWYCTTRSFTVYTF